MQTFARWSVAVLIAVSATAADAPKPLVSRVFVDRRANVFHSPTCKLVTPAMMKLARTAAKMQGIPPATECAQTDAQAREEWKALVANDPTLADSGRVSESSGSSEAPQLARGAASSESPSPNRQTGQTETTKPTWNEFMAATDYSAAEERAMARCNAEWAGDARMLDHCFRRQREAIAALRHANGSVLNQEKRVRCATEWPDDYRMRLRCERK